MLPPRLALLFRRTLVTAGVVGSLVVGAATVSAAAAWTANAAPMESPPLSASDIAARLVDASARSAALEQQIVDLTSRTSDLAQALAAANKRVGTDATTAKTLRAQLAAAQRKLAALTKALKAAPPRAQSPTTAGSTPTPTHHEDDD